MSAVPKSTVSARRELECCGRTGWRYELVHEVISLRGCVLGKPSSPAGDPYYSSLIRSNHSQRTVPGGKARAPDGIRSVGSGMVLYRTHTAPNLLRSRDFASRRSHCFPGVSRLGRGVLDLRRRGWGVILDIRYRTAQTCTRAGEIRRRPRTRQRNAAQTRRRNSRRF